MTNNAMLGHKLAKSLILSCSISMSISVFSADNKIRDCYAMVHKNRIAVFFPLKNSRNNFIWHKNKKEIKNAEYNCSIEPGELSDKTFNSNGIVMSYSVGLLNASEKTVKVGSIDHLLADGVGSIYFKDRSKNSMIDSSGFSVFAKVNNGEVMVFTTQEATTKFLLMKSATHARLIYSSINGENNYSCTVAIDFS